MRGKVVKGLMYLLFGVTPSLASSEICSGAVTAFSLIF